MTSARASAVGSLTAEFRMGLRRSETNFEDAASSFVLTVAHPGVGSPLPHGDESRVMRLPDFPVAATPPCREQQTRPLGGAQR